MFNKYFSFICFTLLFFINPPIVFADIFTSSFLVTSGREVNQGASTEFTTSDITNLSFSDNNRMGSGIWPNNGEYDESRYLEFVFNTNIPNNATLINVSVTHEYYETGTLTGAKLELEKNGSLIDIPLNLPSGTGSSKEISQTIDLISYITTPAELQNLKIKFLACRSGEVTTTKTYHDFIGLSVVYDLPPPPPNNPPEAQNQNILGDVANPIDITLVATDADNDPLNFSIVSQPEKGVLGNISENILTYTPNGSVGDDSFTFKASDGKADSNIATINISLTASTTDPLPPTGDISPSVESVKQTGGYVRTISYQGKNVATLDLINQIDLTTSTENFIQEKTSVVKIAPISNFKNKVESNQENSIPLNASALNAVPDFSIKGAFIWAGEGIIAGYNFISTKTVEVLHFLADML